jgi:hypothetical protein
VRQVHFDDDINSAPTDVEPYVATIDPAQLLHSFLECREAGLPVRIIGGGGHEYADAPQWLGLLRRHAQRPRGPAAEEGLSTSASPRSADLSGFDQQFRVMPILLQKSFFTADQIF